MTVKSFVVPASADSIHTIPANHDHGYMVPAMAPGGTTIAFLWTLPYFCPAQPAYRGRSKLGKAGLPACGSRQPNV